jgi:hypothetical protein
LSDAELSGANLYHAQLAGADLSSAQLAGAFLSDAQLTGTILEKINFAPMNKKEANASADKLYSALKDLPRYSGDSGQVDLANKMVNFRQEITSSVDFSKLADSEGCLAGESALKHLPFCKKTGDPEAQKNAYRIWVRLACQDNTEKHWIAQNIVSRRYDYHFPDFAPLLAAKLQTPDKCPGLASLDDELKRILLDAAKKTR